MSGPDPDSGKDALGTQQGGGVSFRERLLAPGVKLLPGRPAAHVEKAGARPQPAAATLTRTGVARAQATSTPTGTPATDKQAGAPQMSSSARRKARAKKNGRRAVATDAKSLATQRPEDTTVSLLDLIVPNRRRSAATQVRRASVSITEPAAESEDSSLIGSTSTQQTAEVKPDITTDASFTGDNNNSTLEVVGSFGPVTSFPPRPTGSDTQARVLQIDPSYLDVGEEALAEYSSDGTVYLGTWGGRQVAVCVLDQAAVGRIRQLVGAMGAHEHVVRVHGFSQLGYLDCMVMDHACQGPLEAFLVNHPQAVSAGHLFNVAGQLCWAMDHLCSRGILHCALTPYRVLVASFDPNDPFRVHIKLAGFTHARLADDAAIADDDVLLCIDWLAPEVHRYHYVRERSDVWLFGLTLWELFSWNELPADTDYGDLRSTVAFSALHGDLPARPRWCDEHMHNIILSCLQSNPADRPLFWELLGQLQVLWPVYVGQHMAHGTRHHVPSPVMQINEMQTSASKEEGKHAGKEETENTDENGFVREKEEEEEEEEEESEVTGGVEGIMGEEEHLERFGNSAEFSGSGGDPRQEIEISGDHEKTADVFIENRGSDIFIASPYEVNNEGKETENTNPENVDTTHVAHAEVRHPQVQVGEGIDTRLDDGVTRYLRAISRCASLPTPASVHIEQSNQEEPHVQGEKEEDGNEEQGETELGEKCGEGAHDVRLGDMESDLREGGSAYKEQEHVEEEDTGVGIETDVTASTHEEKQEETEEVGKEVEVEAVRVGGLEGRSVGSLTVEQLTGLADKYLAGGSEEVKKAMFYLMAAAERGSSKAQVQLGQQYLAQHRDVDAARLFQQAADRSHPEGHLALARCLQTGRGLRKDPQLAVQYFKHAAHQGLAAARYELGRCYELGIGHSPNMHRARSSYEEAAAGGDASAQARLGQMCEAGEGGMAPDQARALQLYQRAAGQWHPHAQYCLGRLYLQPGGPDYNPVLGADYLQCAAQSGHGQAMLSLAQCYEQGTGVEESQQDADAWYGRAAQAGIAGAYEPMGRRLQARGEHEQAVGWYKLSAEAGQAEGMLALARCLLDGTGVMQDQTEALRYVRMASDAGLADARHHLALHLLHTSPTDPTEPAALLQLAAAQGHGPSAYQLAMCYRAGLGVDHDDKLAAAHLKTAAAAGHREALYELGECYQHGRGLDVDLDWAAKAYSRAAGMGHGQAMYALGATLLAGRGVKRDTKAARRWLQQATQQGVVEAWVGLGQLHLHEKEYPQAMHCFHQAGPASHVALAYLGAMYEKGRGVALDLPRARELYVQAADLGSGTACFRLASMLPEGPEATVWLRKGARLGCAKSQHALGWVLVHDPSDTVAREGLALLRAAAAAGQREAQHALGLCYLDGLVVGRDSSEAERYLRQASAQRLPEPSLHLAQLLARAGRHKEAAEHFGLAVQLGAGPAAQYGLGQCMLLGQGTHQDTARGMALLRAAADGGWPDAVVDLAQRLHRGIGVDMDPQGAATLYALMAAHSPEAAYALGAYYTAGPEAIGHLQVAALGGHAKAMFQLGWRHQFGVGTGINLAAAMDYYIQAAGLGHPQALCNLALLRHQWLGYDYTADLQRAASLGCAEAQTALEPPASKAILRSFRVDALRLKALTGAPWALCALACAWEQGGWTDLGARLYRGAGRLGYIKAACVQAHHMARNGRRPEAINLLTAVHALAPCRSLIRALLGLQHLHMLADMDEIRDPAAVKAIYNMFAAAAAAGEPLGIANEAVMLGYGWGTPRDVPAALACLNELLGQSQGFGALIKEELVANWVALFLANNSDKQASRSLAALMRSMFQGTFADAPARLLFNTALWTYLDAESSQADIERCYSALVHAAKQGDQRSIYALVWMLNRDPVRIPTKQEDRQEIARLVADHSTHSDSRVCLQVGHLHMRGVLLPQAPTKAVECWTAAAAAKEDVSGCLGMALSSASYALGHAHIEGVGVPAVDLACAASHFLRAAEAGHLLAQIRVAAAYLAIGRQGDYWLWMRRLALQGLAEAQWAVALHDITQAPDSPPAQACAMLQAAAEQGHVGASYLCVALLGGSMASSEARRHMEVAVRGGHLAATGLLVCSLMPGGSPGRYGMEQREACWLLQQCALEGSAVACLAVGLCWLHGWGVACKGDMAEHFLDTAMRTGDTQVQCLAARALAGMYLNPETYPGIATVHKDTQEAAWCLAQAVEHGDKQAMYVLAAMYRAGVGLPQDLDMSAALYEAAAGQDHTPTALEWACITLSNHPDDQSDPLPQATVQIQKAAAVGLSPAPTLLTRLCVAYPSALDAMEVYGMLKQQAEGGSGEAHMALAELAVAGLGPEQGYVIAEAHYLVASKLGWTPADLALGHMYLHATGVGVDYEKAQAHFLRRMDAIDVKHPEFAEVCWCMRHVSVCMNDKTGTVRGAPWVSLAASMASQVCLALDRLAEEPDTRVSSSKGLMEHVQVASNAGSMCGKTMLELAMVEGGSRSIIGIEDKDPVDVAAVLLLDAMDGGCGLAAMLVSALLVEESDIGEEGQVETSDGHDVHGLEGREEATGEGHVVPKGSNIIDMYATQPDD